MFQKSHYIVEETESQNFNSHNINDANSELFIFFHSWLTKLFSEESKVQNTEARKVAGSAIYKQSKTVWNCVVL